MFKLFKVRQFLIGQYAKAIREWDLDGLKLDFVDMFIPGPGTVMEQAGGRDIASINIAVDRLLTDIRDTLKKIKRGIMIEFRQRYTGPAMRKYGNMFRAHDCANSFTENRAQTLDLRFLAGQTAVHSDMLIWNYAEPAETAAFQLLNVMFAVPQLSVRLEEIPVAQKQMLGFSMGFWNKHRATLLGPGIKPLYPDKNYPIVYCSSKAETIIWLYQSGLAIDLNSQSASKPAYVMNATGSDRVILNLSGTPKIKRVLIYDCRGKLMSDKIRKLKSDLFELRVPPSGLLKLLN